MSISLDIFCFVVPFMMLFVTFLSVFTVVGGCQCHNSARVVCMYVVFWKFSNNSTNSASVADAMTFLIILHAIRAGPFSGFINIIGVLYFFPRRKYPPALLHYSGSEM